MADETEDDPRDVERFSRIEQRMALRDELQRTIGYFLAEFAVFESIYLTAALKAVSSDATVIEYLPELMDLSNRLKLLRYLGAARNLPQSPREDIKAVCNAADKLSGWRNEIAHGASVLSIPFLTEPNSTDVVAGVQRPRSKRIVPEAIGPDDALALHRTWLLSADVIRRLVPPTMDLQHAAHQLANKLECYKRGEPWEHLIVVTVSVPKRE